MGRKWMTVLAACLGLFLLTACGSKEYESAEDYIQLNPDAQAEEDTLGTDVAQEDEDADASGVPKRGIAIDEAEDDDTESDAADTSAAQEDDTSLGDIVGSLFGGSSSSSSSQWPSVMEKYQEILEASDYNDWAYFRTEDLNSDGIPELLIAIPDDAITIITHNNHGGKTALEDCGCEVPIWYYPGSGIYGLGSDGDEKTYYYLESTDHNFFDFSSYLDLVIGQEFLSEDSSIGICRWWYGRFIDPDDYETDEEYWAAKVAEVESWYGKYVNSDDYETNEEYQEAIWSEMENGVSEERFQELLNDATGGVEKVELPPYTEWYKDTEENREAYLK